MKKIALVSAYAILTAATTYWLATAIKHLLA